MGFLKSEEEKHEQMVQKLLDSIVTNKSGSIGYFYGDRVAQYMCMFEIIEEKGYSIVSANVSHDMAFPTYHVTFRIK